MGCSGGRSKSESMHIECINSIHVMMVNHCALAFSKAMYMCYLVLSHVPCSNALRILYKRGKTIVEAFQGGGWSLVYYKSLSVTAKFNEL